MNTFISLATKEMKAVRKTLLTQPCRSREITDNERETFSSYSHLQRYFPALDLFTIPDSILSQKNIELPYKYQITNWMESSPDQPKIWNALRILSPTGPVDEPPSPEPCEVFVKVVHLLNPIDIIKEKYVCPEHPLLPQSEKTWKSTLLKLHSHNNQAYVDAVANFVLSRFRELDMTPHCILSYGAFTGISNQYQYNISLEYDTYRQCRWFWKGMESHSARLTVLSPHDASEEWDAFYKEITTCPFDDEESDVELEPLAEITIPEDHSDAESVESVTFDTLEENAENASDMFEINKKITKRTSYKRNDSDKSDASDKSEPSDASDGLFDDSSEESESEPCEILLEIPNMPIIMIAQEAQEGVMDRLLDEDRIDGFERESQGWEERWVAWMFQIVAALTFLQSAICFTHNDLHSNNILWRKTDKPFLYYRKRDGTVWKVPTFGKIFTIIDFGRAIFRLGRHLWVSDDHWPNQDAGDQYNFGPFFDHTKPKVIPNSSFDLSRLAVSLIDGLFNEPPPKKKGKGVSIMSEEGSWKVYETKSPLYNLLWSWTINDKGETIYETEDGEEKYEGFDLYIRIAQDVHRAVPKEQLHRPVFQSFIWTNRVPPNETVYSLGV
jgi:hypothetical protein